MDASVIGMLHQREASVRMKGEKDTLMCAYWSKLRYYGRALTVAGLRLKEALLLSSLFTNQEDQGILIRGVSAPPGVLQ